MLYWEKIGWNKLFLKKNIKIQQDSIVENVKLVRM